jgi:hypothetical protein
MRKKQLNVTVDPRTARIAKVKSYGLGLTMSAWVESLIKKAAEVDYPDQDAKLKLKES